jgi:5-methylcytosine-specific restriction endonuclease McrA
MNINTLSLAHVSDDQLLVRVKELAREERVATAQLLLHLAEMEERRLHCREGCSSLFSYCVEVLHLSEPAAYRRIKMARLARRFPIVLEMIADGSIHLAALDVLAGHLTDANHAEVLTRARHKTKREVEEQAARLRPLPDVVPMVRKLPQQDDLARSAASVPVASAVMADTIFNSPVGAVSAASAARVVRGSQGEGPPTAPEADRGHRPTIAPLSTSRYKIQFTAGAETYRKLRQAQELLRHRIPNGDPATIVDTALTVLLERLLREKTGATARPRQRKHLAPDAGEAPRVKSPAREAGEAGRRRVDAGKPTESRHIPAAVKRAVWKRDRGRCAFTAKDGRRCTSRGPLEFHHVEPYMLGGRATIENISLRCRAHNGYERELRFGKWRARIPGEEAPNAPETLPGESSGAEDSRILLGGKRLVRRGVERRRLGRKEGGERQIGAGARTGESFRFVTEPD